MYNRECEILYREIIKTSSVSFCFLREIRDVVKVWTCQKCFALLTFPILFTFVARVVLGLCKCNIWLHIISAEVPPSKPAKRLLMRQHRIKKESDVAHTSPDSEPGSPHFTSGSGLLSLQPVRIERQSSEPPPSSSPTLQPNPSTPNLLTVPQPTFLVKQHSHPLLPSQQSSTPPTPTSLLVQRQLSQPAPGQTCVVPSPTLHHVHLVAAPMQTPPNQKPAGRAVSPSVVIEQLPVLRVVTDPTTTDTAKSSNQGGLRVRTEELRRASSSPQV